MTRSPRMTGSGKKDTPAVEEPIAPVAPEPPKEAPRANEPEQIVYINLAELHAFKNCQRQLENVDLWQLNFVG